MRSLGLIQSIGGVSEQRGRRLLRESAGEAKTAIVMARLGCSAVELASTVEGRARIFTKGNPMSLRPDQAIQAMDLVQKIALFKGASADQQAAIVLALDFKSLVAGKVILLEQEISKTLYILGQGSVGIWRRKNNEKDRVALLRAPDFFGEISMFTDAPATAQVKTEEASQFFMLTRERFDALALKDPAIGELIHANALAIQAQRLPIQKPPLP